MIFWVCAFIHIQCLCAKIHVHFSITRIVNLEPHMSVLCQIQLLGYRISLTMVLNISYSITRVSNITYHGTEYFLLNINYQGIENLLLIMTYSELTYILLPVPGRLWWAWEGRAKPRLWYWKSLIEYQLPGYWISITRVLKINY